MIHRSLFPEHGFAWAVVLAALTVNACGLLHQLSIGQVDLNDSVFHYTLADGMVRAVAQGENPVDFWLPEISFGYPVARTYQPLGHLGLLFLYLLFGKSVPLMTLFTLARYLLVVLLPLTVYAGGRLIGLRQAGAAAAALLSPLIATNSLFGIEYGSYLWRGSGLYTQAVAMHCLILAIGLGSRAIRRGRGLAPAGLLLALTFLAHFIYGYMGALTLCMLCVIPDAETPVRRRLLHVMYIGAVTLGLVAFELVPLLRDAPIVNQSRWEPLWKWDSFGFVAVFKLLFTGALLDFGRIPVLSLLALAGAVAAGVSLLPGGRLPRINGKEKRSEIAHGHEEQSGRQQRFTCVFLLWGTVLWLFLFCGRTAWGGLLFKLLGMSDQMQLHRMVGGVHIFLLFLAGIGLQTIWDWLGKRNWQLHPAVIVATVTVLLLLPALAERTRYLREDAEWGWQNLGAYREEKDAIETVVSKLKARPGRTYAGLSAGWGGQFKVGQVPLYAFLSEGHVPAVAFLYHAMALTSDILVRFDEQNPAHYRLFNIGTVLAEPTRDLPPFLAPLEQVGRFRLLSAPGGGYFELVSVPYVVPCDRKKFYEVTDPWLQSVWVGARQHLWLDFDGLAPANLPRLSSTESLPSVDAAPELGKVQREEEDGPGAYRADVVADRDCFLLFKMTFHPNWQVTVDGQLRDAVMLSPGFVGVALSPGRHVITCRYQPERWKMLLLWPGLFLLAGVAVAERRGWLGAR